MTTSDVPRAAEPGDDPAAQPYDGRAAGEAIIRPYQPGDRETLYRICRQTGDGGNDATGLYRYPDLLGDVFVGPYCALEPRLAFVVDAGTDAEGYVLGALDSADFARRCESSWWPNIREKYHAAQELEGFADGWLLRWIASPPAVPEFSARFPSHLHIDLLAQRQSGGWGRRLIRTLLDALVAAGSVGVHLGVGRANERAVGFYRHLGFTDIDGDDATLWLGRELR